MSTNSQQATIVGEPSGKSAQIETVGNVIRRFLNIPGTLVDECKIHINADGLKIKAVDPANVAMVEIEAPAEAFDEFDVTDEMIVGVNLDTLQKRASTARMGKNADDGVAIDFNATRTRLTVDREYGSTELERTDEWLNIDPDAIRQEPEIPDIVDQMHWSAEIDAKALKAAFDGVGASSDHAEIKSNGDDLQVFGRSVDSEGDITEATHITAEGVVETDEDEDGASMFSLDYLEEFASALKTGKVDDVEVMWGDEFPAFFGFERTDDEDNMLYEGRLMIAPRIRDSDRPGGE